MVQNEIGYLIKQISGKLRADADAYTKAQDLTFSQAHILAYLAHCGGEATQKEIERFLETTHPTVIGLVRRLEAKSFVESYPSVNDKRVKIVRMTPKAWEHIHTLRSGFEEKEKTLMRGFTEDEKAQLIRMLQMVYENLG